MRFPVPRLFCDLISQWMIGTAQSQISYEITHWTITGPSLEVRNTRLYFLTQMSNGMKDVFNVKWTAMVSMGNQWNRSRTDDSTTSIKKPVHYISINLRQYIYTVVVSSDF
jgi:hypothetical protein